MVDTRVCLTKSNGWTRLGLPGAMFMLFATPMLWALGAFDGTAEPLLHAIVFGLFGIFCFGLTPWLIGWALQGFLVRRKTGEESDESAESVRRPAAPRSASRGPAQRAKA